MHNVVGPNSYFRYAIAIIVSVITRRAFIQKAIYRLQLNVFWQAIASSKTSSKLFQSWSLMHYIRITQETGSNTDQIGGFVVVRVLCPCRKMPFGNKHCFGHHGVDNIGPYW